MTQTDIILEVKDLCVEFRTAEGTVQAVDHLSYVLHKGEKLGIVGESGSGKSVSSLGMMQLIPNPPGQITGGEILYLGRDLVKTSERDMQKIRGNEISMIFQEPMTSLNPIIKCGKQIAESLRLHRGMKIRVPNSSMYINCLTAMGATPTGMPFSETISAVQQGVIDGLEGNMNAYSTNGSAEVCKNMSLTNHLVGTCGAYISTKVWNSIPEEYRTIIQEEFTKGAKELTDFTNASFDETKAKLEKEQGCSFNEVDVDAFRAAVQPEYDRMVKEDGVTAGFYEQAQAILAQYRQANK